MAGAAPFMLVKYSLSLCGGKHEEEGGGASHCAVQDIELPLPFRDTLNAPCGG